MIEIPDKPFYKIGEVCQYTDTQPYVLRFWESEFPQLAPDKNRTGQRVYSREDISTVLKIKELLYDQEYTIAGARKWLEQQGELEAVPVLRPVPLADPAPKRRKSKAGKAEDNGGGADAVELAALKRRAADLEERWRNAEAELDRVRQAHEADKLKRERIALKLEGLLKGLDGPDASS